MITEQGLPAIESEKLNFLIANGLTFKVERTIQRRTKGLLGWCRKGITEKETLTFKIEEPTLATLDRLASEQIELKIDNTALASERAASEVLQLTREQANRCAKIVAIAVLGGDYMTAVQRGVRTKYIPGNKKLAELTELFFQNIKPSKLIGLVMMINTMSNHGDFCSSIRLMSASPALKSDSATK